MPDLIWRSNGSQDVAQVTVGETTYTFEDGIPTDVPQEHYAAVQAKLQALADTSSAAAGDPEI